MKFEKISGPVQIRETSSSSSTILKIIEKNVSLEFVDDNIYVLHSFKILNTHSSKTTEGEFIFKFPRDLRLFNYGVDIRGRLVLAVPILKKKARKMFEERVRIRESASSGENGGEETRELTGVVEIVHGSEFKLRLFPMNPQKTRTVCVILLKKLEMHDLDGVSNRRFFYFPSEFEQDLQKFRISFPDRVFHTKKCLVDVNDKLLAVPTTSNSDECDTSMIQNIFGEKKELMKGIYFEVDSAKMSEKFLDKSLVFYEKTENDREVFFYSRIQRPKAKSLGSFSDMKKKNVVVFWDLSVSRTLNSAIMNEIQVLEAILETLNNKNGVVEVEIYTFANEEKVNQRSLFKYESKDSFSSIKDYLSNLVFDGATRFPLATYVDVSKKMKTNDLILFFTDGKLSIQDQDQQKLLTSCQMNYVFKVPTFFVSSSTKPNLDLKFFCDVSGGGFYQMNKISEIDICKSIMRNMKKKCSNLVIEKVEKSKGIKEVYFVECENHFNVWGKCVFSEVNTEKEEFTVTFSGSFGTQKLVETRKITFSSSENSRSVTKHIIRVSFIQEKIKFLSVFYEVNCEDILALGRDHKILTKNTNLLILQSIEDHLKYNISPGSEFSQNFREKYNDEVESRKRLEEEKFVKYFGRHVVKEQFPVLVEWYETEGQLGEEIEADDDNDDENGDDDDESDEDEFDEDDELEYEDDFAAKDLILDETPTPAGVSNGDLFEGEDKFSDIKLRRKDSFYGLDRSSQIRRLIFQKEMKNKLSDTGNLRSSGKFSLLKSSIPVQPYDYNTPYMIKIKSIDKNDMNGVYNEYIHQRSFYHKSPAFFLDSATYFLEVLKERKVGLKIMSNILELFSSDYLVLQIIANMYLHCEEYEMCLSILKRLEKVGVKRSYELARCYKRMGEFEKSYQAFMDIFKLHADRFGDIIDDMAVNEVVIICLIDLNHLHRLSLKEKKAEIVDKRIVLKQMDSFQLRVTMTWDTKRDLNLHINHSHPKNKEEKEHIYYGRNVSSSGGLYLTDSFSSQGGPDIFVQKEVPAKSVFEFFAKVGEGGYDKKTMRYPITTVYLEIVRNYMRENESRKNYSVRLGDNLDKIMICEIQID